MKQARADLQGAKDSLKTGHFEWACFQAQQSAEKALKSFLYQKGLRSILTHSIRDLLRECAKYEKEFQGLSREGRFLDTVYIPLRYPNGLPGENYPADFYTEEDGKKCIKSADLILKEVERYLRN